MADVNKRTLTIQDNLNTKNQIASQNNAQNLIDAALLQQINDGIKNVRFDIANNMNIIKVNNFN